MAAILRFGKSRHERAVCHLGFGCLIRKLYINFIIDRNYLWCLGKQHEEPVSKLTVPLRTISEAECHQVCYCTQIYSWTKSYGKWSNVSETLEDNRRWQQDDKKKWQELFMNGWIVSQMHSHINWTILLLWEASPSTENSQNKLAPILPWL